MASKQQSFTDQLIKKMDEYTDKAFDEPNPEKRQKYRDIVKQMQKLFIELSALE